MAYGGCLMVVRRVRKRPVQDRDAFDAANGEMAVELKLSGSADLVPHTSSHKPVRALSMFAASYQSGQK